MTASKRQRGPPGSSDSQIKPGIASPLVSTSGASSAPSSPHSKPFAYTPFRLVPSPPARYGSTVRWRAPPRASPPAAARAHSPASRRRRRHSRLATPLKPTLFDFSSRSLPYASSTLLDSSSSFVDMSHRVPPCAGAPLPNSSCNPASLTALHRASKCLQQTVEAAALMHDSASSPLLLLPQGSSEAAIANTARSARDVSPARSATPDLSTCRSLLERSPWHSPDNAPGAHVATITSLYRNALAASPPPTCGSLPSSDGSPAACSASLHSPSLTPPLKAASAAQAVEQPRSRIIPTPVGDTAGPLSTLSPAEAVPHLLLLGDAADSGAAAVPDFLTRLFTPESSANSAGRAVDAAWSTGGASCEVRRCPVECKARGL